jgi:outer membrane protein OmpA-like peptidoglycan-associated protein
MSFGCSPRAGRAMAGLLVVLLTVAITSPVLAQQSDSNPKWDVFAGYQWMHPGATVPASAGDPNNPTPFTLPDMARGLGGAFTWNFDQHFGLETDAGYSRDTNSASSEWTVSAGPRLMFRTPDASFFVHALGSYNRVTYDAGVTNSNGIGAILGGGMDLPILKQLAWRVFQVDYVWARHDYPHLAAPQFPDLRRVAFEGVRLRTGVVFNWGGAPELTPAAACSVQPAEVMVGEPIAATVSASNFNPKHPLTYSWSGNGGQVVGKDTAATIDTKDAAPGSYTVTAQVTDPKGKKNNQASCTANFTIKPLPPKNPPTMSITADPSTVQQGVPVTLHANCTSPDGVPVSVANWQASGGSISGSGDTATLTTAGASPGTITVNASCSDNRGLNAQASTQVSVQNPPPPQVNPELEADLKLGHSIYFQTARPTEKDPRGGLLPTQQEKLLKLATNFKTYLVAKPDAHLVLEAHADVRGSDAYNQALTERRAAGVKAYLVDNGVPENTLETVGYGKQRNLTMEEVKDAIEKNTDLTPEERRRAQRNIMVIKLASNRRVDIVLKSAGGEAAETSVKQFPFNSSDALSLIGGREGEMKKAPAKKGTGKTGTKKKPSKSQ